MKKHHNKWFYCFAIIWCLGVYLLHQKGAPLDPLADNPSCHYNYTSQTISVETSSGIFVLTDKPESFRKYKKFKLKVRFKGSEIRMDLPMTWDTLTRLLPAVQVAIQTNDDRIATAHQGTFLLRGPPIVI